MIARTWPYGTRRNVRVLAINAGRDPVLGRVLVVVCQDLEDETEGYLLMVDPTAVEDSKPPVKPRQRRQIEFVCGGLTGGYWRILDRDQEAKRGKHSGCEQAMRTSA